MGKHGEVRFDTKQCSKELLSALRGNNRPSPIAHRKLIAVYSKSEVIAHFRLKLKKYAEHKHMQRHIPKWERCLAEVRSFS